LTIINFKDNEAEALDSTYASRIFGVGVFTPECEGGVRSQMQSNY